MIHILFDNYAKGDSCSSLWGFSVYLPAYKLLFDTGSNGRVLLQNLKNQEIDISEIAYLFVTHDHWDHIGGLDSILELNPNLILYIPETFSKNHIRDLKRLSKEVILIGRKPTHLFGFLYSTGILGTKDPEHSLVIADSTSVLLTGCGHYGISNIVQVASKTIGREIFSVMGGFHLLQKSEEEINKEIAILQELGVEVVLPTHCTGDLAIELFSKAYGDALVYGGVEKHTLGSKLRYGRG